MKVPILLIAFRRPKETEKVLKEIKKYYPDNLYVFIDGPLTDDSNVNNVKNLVSKGDWALNLHTNFQKNNLGCGKGPVEAINWILSDNKYAIILEDDCVPSESFFKYMEWALNNKKDDNDCFMVSGNKFSFGFGNKSIQKTRFSFTHGWGTWQRAWIDYDYDLDSWSIFENKIHRYIPFYANKFYWKKKFNKVHKDQQKTYWDYQWQYHIWINRGYSLEPPKNLIQNIGYNESATHTLNKNDWRSQVQSHVLASDYKYFVSKFKLLNELQNSLIEVGFVSYILKIFHKMKVKYMFK